MHSLQDSVHENSITTELTPQLYKVLIVEDNPADMELLRTILRSDFQIESAGDGESGFEKALNTRPDCIISDVRMPFMSGFTFLKKVRANQDISGIPLILLTSLNDPIDKIQGYDLLADLYLTKPVDLFEIKAAVKSLVRMNKSRVATAPEVNDSAPPGLGISEDDQRFLSKLLKAMHENMENCELMVDDLAQAAHVSKKQLERRLKKLENISPREYIRQVRLEHAKKLIEAGLPSNMSDLASRVGFKDPKHFSKIYKSFYGFSPRLNS